MSLEDPISIVRAFDAALNAHDLEAVMGLFAEDATVRYVPAPPPGPAAYEGKPEIRGLVQRLIEEGIAVQAEHYEATGERVTSRDRRTCAARHEQLGGNPVILTCEAVVRGGKIASLTFTFSPESLRRIQATMGTRRQ